MAADSKLPAEALDNDNGDLVAHSLRACAAAKDAHEAAGSDPKTPKRVLALTAKALEEAKTVLLIAQQHHDPASSPRPKAQRQSIAEFTTMLGEEVKEAATESVANSVIYAERGLRKAKSLIEDHFQIDEAFRMLGPIRQDANLARDVHDVFNLVALLPVIFFNIINWSCSSWFFCGLFSGDTHPPGLVGLWHGEAFMTFWWVTLAYFIIDLLFMVLLPHCVRSPGVIIKHHVATIGYICVPYARPEYGWLMGACMIVEVNTWFLIARRSFNKRGDKMFQPGVSMVKTLRMLTVSSCFYVSWFVIRLGFYPYLLKVIVQEWWSESMRVGTPINLIAVTPIMQCVFLYLNIKWTIDLIRSKMKGARPSKGL